MTVHQRLFLTTLPGVLGVLAMGGLAYWGEYGREAPESLLVIGALASVASLVVAWRNAHYVARRIDALAGRRPGPDARSKGVDELDTIEQAVVAAETTSEKLAQAADARVLEYSRLLTHATGEIGRRLDEVRLPLHILLDSHFGDLNENQEEMLGAAQDAAMAVSEELRVIARILDIDGGRVHFQPEPIRPLDLFAPVLPHIKARIGDAGGHLNSDIPPDLPHIEVDQQHTREALSLVLNEAVGRLEAGAELGLTVTSEPTRVTIAIRDGSPSEDGRHPLARRLILAQGGDFEVAEGVTRIRLPRFRTAPLV